MLLHSWGYLGLSMSLEKRFCLRPKPPRGLMCWHQRHPLSSRKPSQCTPEKICLSATNLQGKVIGVWGWPLRTLHAAHKAMGMAPWEGWEIPLPISLLDFWLSCCVCRGLL